MKKFNQLNGRMIRQVILDLYDTTQLSTAKEVLSNALTDLKLETWVGVTRRRRKKNRDNPGQKSKFELDDILAMIVYIDKNVFFS